MNAKGFLLSEALIALAVLLLGLTVSLETFSLAAHQARRSRQDTQLAACAQIVLIEQATQRAVPDPLCADFQTAERQTRPTGGAVTLVGWHVFPKNQQEIVFETYVPEKTRLHTR